jgi:lysozyme
MHGITENGAKMLLRRDILTCHEQLKKHFKFYKDLTPNRQYALLDMCFQLGIKGLKKFKLMLAELEKGNYEMAAYQCLASAYAKQTPKRAKRIAYVIKTDIYPKINFHFS